MEKASNTLAPRKGVPSHQRDEDFDVGITIYFSPILLQETGLSPVFPDVSRLQPRFPERGCRKTPYIVGHYNEGHL